MAEACSAVDVIGLLGAVSAFVTAVVALAALSLWSRQLTHPPRSQWMSKAIEASAQWAVKSAVVLQIDGPHKKLGPVELIDRLTEAWMPLAPILVYAKAELAKNHESLDKTMWEALVLAIAESRDVFGELQRFEHVKATKHDRLRLEKKINDVVEKISSVTNALSYARAPWQFY
ncbi:hypothetical protein EHS17_09760 [Rhodobacteraceae bacterium CH30]|nr:hypothetical protein EHS17_09760 [Rhodobacteraceae bacterium CH30]